jgi:hypothetical protein
VLAEAVILAVKVWEFLTDEEPNPATIFPA